MPESEEKPLVVIRSLVYNHEPYLRDSLEGFVMQQTTFPFVAVVHDDCSTDGSAAIIREYAEKYPHIIKPVYETENQYSKKDGSLRRAMDAACGKYGAKYYALCEGDDYWTDPRKLQKQVDFLETQPDYTMVCSDAVVRTPDGDLTEDDFRRMGWHRYTEECDIPTEDVISKGGWLIYTASIVYRCGLRDKYPDACKRAATGDYTLQIFAALNGKIHYFHEQMVTYRFRCDNSWTAMKRTRSFQNRCNHLAREIDMLLSLDDYSHGQYRKEFYTTIAQNIKNLMAELPEQSGELLRMFGRHLLFKRLKACTPGPQGTKAKVLLLIKRFCFHPYYPDTTCEKLVIPILRPFYRVSGRKKSLGLGLHGVVSIVEQEKGGHAVYLLGKRVY